MNLAMHTGDTPKRRSRKPPHHENQAAFGAKQRVIVLIEGDDTPAPPRTAKIVLLHRRKRIHKTLASRQRCGRGLADHMWSLGEIVGLLNEAKKRAA
jgi:hypothetical protein